MRQPHGDFKDAAQPLGSDPGPSIPQRIRRWDATTRSFPLLHPQDYLISSNLLGCSGGGSKAEDLDTLEMFAKHAPTP